ncbi:hypothetical protein TRAPUB_4082 [Trametes pubescens]|uniref:Uncharacterized protein n=1 Tax=Trametes pubescens TaxID=154538 RepID=A0A1M2VBT0_TRAPU|nr:hypothetical protein TRAPUB_4082 [Trametes pubescens]
MPFVHGPISYSHVDRIHVSASLRASGHEGLPDTYYLRFFPRGCKTVGVGSRLLMEHDNSVYQIVLGPIRVRGKHVVEFLGYCRSFLPGFCFVQVPILRAAVSKFAIVDFLRGLFSLTDPLPERRILATPPLDAPPASIAGDSDSDISALKSRFSSDSGKSCNSDKSLASGKSFAKGSRRSSNMEPEGPVRLEVEMEVTVTRTITVSA